MILPMMFGYPTKVVQGNYVYDVAMKRIDEYIHDYEKLLGDKAEIGSDFVISEDE